VEVQATNFNGLNCYHN